MLALALLLDGGIAFAYVRSTSPKSGKPFAWLESCIVVKADSRGSQDVSIDQINQTLAKSASNWTTRTNDCTYLRLSTAPADVPLDVAADGQPAVVFRDQFWGRPGGMPHDPAAIGLTTVFHVSAPGQPGDATIIDTDIELNGVNYTFTTDPLHAQPRPSTFAIADLENTLTHELGHVQGLAHTCWDHLTETPPLDDKGNPIPDCNDPNLPNAIINTTMFPYSQMPGETSKRTLSQDDVNGVCTIYPASATPNACHQEIVGGCSLPATRSRPGVWALLLVLAILLRQRRETT